ncbi:hypothetical protein [Nocardioides terrisoli]|uniref:hypothetical protein n=1 Tax=Nocardioides terrisoli TaxID=3388267 RepID=UPI00287BB73E|nr:hypothetical protein [Nocardioides marmorisolisilvae]
MRHYLLESFLPDHTTGADIAAACKAASEEGQAVLRHLLVMPEAELCLFVVEARTPEIACVLVRAAGLSVDCEPTAIAVVDVPVAVGADA